MAHSKKNAPSLISCNQVMNAAAPAALWLASAQPAHAGGFTYYLPSILEPSMIFVPPFVGFCLLMAVTQRENLNFARIEVPKADPAVLKRLTKEKMECFNNDLACNKDEIRTGAR